MSTCSNVFLEKDGFCTQCGKVHKVAKAPTAKVGSMKRAKMLDVPAIADVYKKFSEKLDTGINVNSCEWYWLQPYDAFQMSKLGTRDFSVHEYEFGDFDWGRCNVMKNELGNVHISSSLLFTLTGWKARDTAQAFSLGHKQWFLVDKEFLERALDRASYPARNKNEAAVRLRNIAILTWINRLSGGSYVSR